MTDKTYGPDKLTIERMHSNRADAKAAGHSHTTLLAKFANGDISIQDG